MRAWPLATATCQGLCAVGFEINLTAMATTLIGAGLLALVGKVINMGTRITVLESHAVGTEQMRAIMADVQAPLLHEIGKLEEQINAMQVQLANRRSTD